MKRISVVLLGALLVSVYPATFAVRAESDVPYPPCGANDPTGTPLNVRSQPQGRIIARLQNGTTVARTNTPARGKWVEVSVQVGDRQVVGWVFRNYLACG